MATLYADDPDVFADFVVTAASGGTNDWASPTVETGTVVPVEIVGTWQGDPGATRTLRVPLATLGAGWHSLRLQVPNGNDVNLGRIYLTA